MPIIYILRNIAIAAITSVVLVACSQESAPSSQSGASSESASTYNLSLGLPEFMMNVMEPIADTLWKSAGWILDEHEGYYELYPTDEAGWQMVYDHGAMVVEAGNMLLLPGRVLDGAWVTYSQAISTVGRNIMSAAAAQNNDDLFQAGAQLYSVCTACHQAYNPEVMERFTPNSRAQ